MNELNESTRNPVADGVYDCIVTGVRRQEKHFGKDAKIHFILSIGVRPEDDENAEIFYAELPVIFTVGQPWDFYDKAQNKSVVRKCTSQDVADAWAYAERVFPDWAKHNSGLDEDATLRDSIAWFDASCRDTKVRAKLKNRPYTSQDGEEKYAHDATLYAASTTSSVADDFDAAFGKSLMVSGIRIGRSAAKADKKPVAASAKPAAPKETPAAPKAPKAAPAAPAPKTAKVYTKDDAWGAYEEHQSKVDPLGEKFWDRCAEAVGKDASEWESYTSADWEKCVSAFVGF